MTLHPQSSSTLLRRTAVALVLGLALTAALPLTAQVTPAFTYQGELRTGGNPANASFDMEFRLFNAASGGSQIGPLVARAGVAAVNGLFNVQLDFGPAQFAGDRQWLEVRIKPAGSGSYETLSPRTEMTATPYALGAVAALPNSVTTTSLVDATVQGVDIAPGAVGTTQVNSTQVQRRVNGSCSGSQGVQSVAADGSVSCGDFAGSGTVTSVATGAGLTGGPITSSGTLSVAPGGIGAAEIDGAQVQRRVTGSCAGANFVQQIGEDGSVACAPAGGASGWALSGNAGTNPATNFIGTTDAQPFVVRTQNTPSLRIDPNVGNGGVVITSNTLGGSSANSLTPGVRGASIGGGGVLADSDPDLGSGSPNRITDHYGVVSGGFGNRAGDDAEPLFGAPFATVGGGRGNISSGNASTVGGGWSNTAGDSLSSVAGGFFNSAGANSSTVGGGQFNNAGGTSSTIAGGRSNLASAADSSVSGGASNGATAMAAAVGGGQDNQASGSHAVVGGGAGNMAGFSHATVGGGLNNRVESVSEQPDYATIGGGRDNHATGTFSTIAGGQDNGTAQLGSTVGGGKQNQALAGYATVGGGIANVSVGSLSTIAGGASNAANGGSSTIAGGEHNAASGIWSTIGGGHSNLASTPATTVAGGELNRSEANAATVGGGRGNVASAGNATIPGGVDNLASAPNTFAAGVSARATRWGMFTWASAQRPGPAPFDPMDDSVQAGGVANGWTDGRDTFNVYAPGGVWFVTGFTGGNDATGPYLTAGANAWSIGSSRTLKSEFRPIDPGAVLARVIALPITTWRYKSEPDGIRHMGAMAEDFSAAFGLGPDTRSINSVDGDGVALAAIQGLNAKLEAENAELRAELAELRQLIETAMANTQSGESTPVPTHENKAP